MWTTIAMPAFRVLPPALLTLYADLLQQAEEAGLGGSVRTQIVKGRRYLKANLGVGENRRTIHLGAADDVEANQRAAVIRDEMQRAKSRRKIVGLLRRAGFPAPAPEFARVLEALARADLFNRGVVLVGASAFQCYSALTGFVLPAASMMTQDLDLATASLVIAPGVGPEVSGAVSKKADTKSLEDILRLADASFRPLPSLRKRAPPSRFRAASGFVVEVVVPLRSRGDPDPVPLPGLSAAGVPLQHLSWLIHQPDRAVALYGAGVPVRVPQPARFAAHKLVLAQKRDADSIKRQKDLAQAAALIEALERSEPHAFADAAQDAASQGKRGWRVPIERSLQEIGRADLIEWL
jgi:hypothetical protein